MEYLVIAILVAAFLWMGTSNKSYRRRTKAKGRKTPTLGPRNKIKQYDFDPKYFIPFEGSAHVIDGDTIVVKGQKIRLAGVNAPELDNVSPKMIRLFHGDLPAVIEVDRIIAEQDRAVNAELQLIAATSY